MLDAEDPWINPEFNSYRIAQLHKEKDKRRPRSFTRWLSWLPRSDRLESTSILGSSSTSTPNLLCSSPPNRGLRSSCPLPSSCLVSSASTPTWSTQSLFLLPPEILQYTMNFLDALSIVSLARVCFVCYCNAIAYVAVRSEQFHKDKFIQRTTLRFDIPLGVNPWRKYYACPIVEA